MKRKAMTRECSMTGRIAADRAQAGVGSCRESPGAGLQCVLVKSLGTLVQRLECDAGAAYCSHAGEGPVCFQPKLVGEGWFVLCTSWPPSSQATPKCDDDVGFSACAGLVGDVPLEQRGPEKCGRLAQACRDTPVHASTPGLCCGKWEGEAAG